MPPKEKVVYTESTAAQDLKRRLENDNESALAVAQANTTSDPYGKDEKGKENGYVNTDPVYQNYADDTHKPLAAEEGPFKEAEKAFRETAKPDENDDRSGDNKPSGAYVDTASGGSPDNSSGADSADSSAPFGTSDPSASTSNTNQ